MSGGANAMSDDFETLVAHGKDVYGDVVARSWHLLVAQTDATDPAAIEATCDLQRRLVLAGAEWLALCERVLALAASGDAVFPGWSSPPATAPDAPSLITEDGSAPALAAVDVQPVRARLSAPVEPSVALTGQTSVHAASTAQAYRIFPLIMTAAPARVQLVAMSFNGAEWHPIAAWRRIYQQVVQSLQRSDPERFDTLASTLTMSNGKPLFNRDRLGFTAPIDAGGGWFATGQMPTELILQRLRTLVDWWGLPRESLSVEVVPEQPAPLPPRGSVQPIAADAPAANAAPALEPSTGARVEDAGSLSEQATTATLADVEPAADVLPAASPVEPPAVEDGADVTTDLADTTAAQESEVALAPDAPVEVPAAEQPAPEAPGAEYHDQAPVPFAEPTPDDVNVSPIAYAVNGAADVLPEVPTPAALEDEFTPPPVPQSSNVRWVKTINGTRLPLRPAED